MNDKNKDKLSQIFNDDPFGLLEVKNKKIRVVTENYKLIDDFKEISDFYRKNNKEPERSKDIIEYRLYSRLTGLRKDKEKCEILKEYDEFNLLKDDSVIEVNSLEDIFSSDSFNILDEDDEDIFNMKNVPKITTMPDYVASRKVCTDFDKYEIMLEECQLDIKEGRRELKPFKNGQQIEEGHFFILKGVLLYVDKVGEFVVENGVKNARLRCIFENGTESDMLMRSLGAELYKDGRRVTENANNMEQDILEKFNSISDDDVETGYIYVLKSKSTNDYIRPIKNLYKIGFSTTSVEERVKNSSNEPTYLMAPVTIVTTFKCYNMDVNKFENLLHNFFGQACLELEVTDKIGIKHKPREWFIAPISVIEEVIKLILNGQIVNYKYDLVKEQIVYK